MNTVTYLYWLSYAGLNTISVAAN